jgi:putative membrane protein
MKTRLRIVCGLAALTVLAGPTAAAIAQTSSGTGALTGGAPSAQASKLSAADRRFMTDAIQGDLSEIKMGELAQQKGHSDAAKQFGQMLQQDHSQHLDKAKALAQQSGMVAPSEPDAKQKAMYDRLSKLDGAKFDRQFARAMVSDHNEDIAKYKTEAGSKGPLADFAQQTLPTLEKHLKTAEDLTH